MGKPELENRGDSKKPFDILEQSEVYREKRKGQLFTLIFLKSRSHSIAALILVEKMKPVVRDKDDFECRDKSRVLPYFGNLGLSVFWCEENSKIC